MSTSKCMTRDIPAFAGFARQGMDAVQKDMLCVCGVPADSLPPYRSGCHEGPAAIRKAVGEYIAEYYASPSLTLVDLENDRTSTFLGPDVGIDLGDLADCTLPAQKHIHTAAACLEDIMGRQGIAIMLGGDYSFTRAACLPRIVTDDCGVVLFSRTLTLPALFDAPATNMVELLRDTGCELLAVGLNAYQEHSALAALGHDKAILAATIYKDGTASCIEAIQAFIARKKHIVCCLDMAVLDCAHAAGTPDTNVGGLTPTQLLAITSAPDIAPGFATKLRLLCVTGVAPGLDSRAHTEHVAAQAILHLLRERLFKESPL